MEQAIQRELDMKEVKIAMQNAENTSYEDRYCCSGGLVWASLSPCDGNPQHFHNFIFIDLFKVISLRGPHDLWRY